MKTKGDAVVYRRLYENQAAYNAGHEKPHQILGIGMGGGYCCARIAAILEAFEDEGLTDPFSVIVTVSGAGGAVGGYLSGFAHRVTSIFEYLAISRFIVWNQWRLMYEIDLARFERVLTGVETPFAFDQSRIKKHSSGWWVTAATEEGKSVLLNAQEVAPHAARAVCASSAMPLTCMPVMIDGVRLVDGVAGGNPLPVAEGLRLLGPSRKSKKPVVIIMQSRIHPKYRLEEGRWWPHTARLRFAFSHPMLRDNLARSEVEFAAATEQLATMKTIEWCRIAPTPDDTVVLPFQASIAELQAVRRETLAFVSGELKKARPPRWV